MLPLASDADVNGAVIRGLYRRRPSIDLIRVQDALPDGASDSEVLSWAISGGRVLITNDRKTMVSHARRRVDSGKIVPGIIATTNRQPIGSAIDDILHIADCMSEEEIRHQIVLFLPLR